MTSEKRRNKFLGTSCTCCSLAPRHVCLFTGGLFEQTDFLLAFWPPAHFVCCEKKKKSLSVLFCDTITQLTWSSGYVLRRGCRQHGMKWMVSFILTSVQPHTHISAKSKNQLLLQRCIIHTLWRKLQQHSDFSQSCGVLLQLAHVHSYVSMLNSTSPVLSLFFCLWTLSPDSSFKPSLITPWCSQTWKTKTLDKPAKPCSAKSACTKTQK